MPLPRSMSSLTLCCVWEKMGNNPVESWKKQIQWCSDNDYFSELNQIDGQPMEFEGKIFTDSLQWESSMRFNR